MTIDTDDTRITAVDAAGNEICGAALTREGVWQMYVTQHVATLTGLKTPPHREHFGGGSNAKLVAAAWVQVIAKLYSLAIERSS